MSEGRPGEAGTRLHRQGGHRAPQEGGTRLHRKGAHGSDGGGGPRPCRSPQRLLGRVRQQPAGPQGLSPARGGQVGLPLQPRSGKALGTAVLQPRRPIGRDQPDKHLPMIRSLLQPAADRHVT